MALPDKITTLSESEYLAFERTSETKHEYVAGDVFAMTGASWKHSVICGNITTSLTNQLADSPAFVVASLMRLKVTATKSYRYPDVIVVWDKPHLMDEYADTVLNPTVLIEVLSLSTELVDRNEKLREYRQIESLQAYLLVAQHEPRIERFVRQDADNWLYSDAVGLENSIALPSLGCTLALADVYRKVAFERDNESNQEI